MAILVLDPILARRLEAEREASGSDRFDERWDGVLVMSPLPNNLHQLLCFEIAFVLRVVLGDPSRGTVFTGVNVSDRDDDWTENYRCPDVAVYLPGNPAVDRGTFWHGGPDLAVEIISEHDRSREKLDFYGKVGVRELLILDRDPWSLELYRHDGSALRPIGVARVGATPVASEVLPLEFGLVPGADRPRVVVARRDGQGRWSI